MTLIMRHTQHTHTHIYSHGDDAWTNEHNGVQVESGAK